MKKILPIIILFLVIICTHPIKTLFAQEQAIYPGLATSVEITEEGVEDGDIICTSKEGYVKCKEELSSQIFGVVNADPGAAFETSTATEGFYLLVSDGNANVKVTGPVKEGDYITTSATPGRGMVAAKDGYIVGTALTALESGEGTVVVSINIHPTKLTVQEDGTTTLSGSVTPWQIIREGIKAPILGPVTSLRYILAAFMVVISFVLGFVYFGRVVKTGIEALGRNPLAGRMIQLMVVFNIVIMIVIVGVGLGIAYLILLL